MRPSFRRGLAFPRLFLVLFLPAVLRAAPQEGPRVLDFLDAAGQRIPVVDPVAQGVVEPASGGGAEVRGLEAIQIAHNDPQEGPVVRLVWEETSFHGAESIAVLVDGALVETVSGRPKGTNLPAFNWVSLRGLPTGLHTFRLESAVGAFDETTLEVLEAAPADPLERLRCEVTGLGEAPERCLVVLRWDDPAPSADTVLVFFDSPRFPRPRVAAFTLRGSRGVCFDAPASSYSFEAIAVTRLPGGSYGVSTSTACEAACTASNCGRPVDLRLHQLLYGDSEARVVQALWRDTAVAPSGIVAMVNGIEHLPRADSAPELGFAFFDRLPLGEVTFGVGALCGDTEASEISEQRFNVLAETPHTRPVDGDVLSTYDGATGTFSLNWTNGDPSISLRVFVDLGGEPERRVFLAEFPPDLERLQVPGRDPDDVLRLQFLALAGGHCYASDPIAAVDMERHSSRFVRGHCDGRAPAGLATAIFLLNFLFQGGPAPPCREACDVDASSDVDLVDAVSLLNFLFLGGSAPRGWVEGDDARVRIPTCERAPKERCAASHVGCVQ